MDPRQFSPELGLWQHWHSEAMPVRLGVSSCLLGENVRYDGGHKRDRFVAEQLGAFVEFVPVCPEVELGMGIPRPSVHLVEDGAHTRMVCPSTGEDFTARMRAFARRRARDLLAGGLDGYVLKKDSPSCGLARVRVHRDGATVHRKGVGLFAAELRAACPALPVEEEGRLTDAGLRENFVERVFCRNRWRQLRARPLSRRRLVEFWTAHKMLVRAHGEVAYRKLGKIVAAAGTVSDRRLHEEFETEFFQGLVARATVRRHRNVLQHALGYFRGLLKPAERRELEAVLDEYCRGLLPRIVPVTLLRFLIHAHDVAYLRTQLYFHPHPGEML